MRTKYTDEQLYELERVATDGVRILILRGKDDVEEVFKLIFPSTSDKEYANIEKHKYHSKLGKEEGLMTRRQVEKLHAADLKELRAEMRELYHQGNRLQQRFIDNDLAGLPDGEADPEAYEAAILAVTTEAQDVADQGNRLASEVQEILSFSIEGLADQHYMARLTQRCWYEKDGDDWVLIWDTWEEFFDDHASLTSLLKGETLMWLQGGVPPFVNSPSQVGGDGDTSTQKTD